jgi:glycosyltransferase involved in cell wall biosynthesis
MEFPLVTIFTLIYNTNPKYVIEAIESVRNNNYTNIKHIIIEDCSPDTTHKKVVKQWIAENNYPCEFHEHEVNFGLCKTLNHVLDLTKGKYLIGCSDDVLLENRIIDDVKILETLDETYCMIHSKTFCIDSNGNSLNSTIEMTNIIAEDNYFDTLIGGNFISAPAVTLVSKVIKQVGGYDETLLFEDYEMWLRLSFYGYKIKYHEKLNTKYRIHNQSISMNINFNIEEIKILLKFSENINVKKKIELKITDYFLLKNNVYFNLISLYNQKFKSKLIFEILKLKIPHFLKVLIFKANNQIAKIKSTIK